MPQSALPDRGADRIDAGLTRADRDLRAGPDLARDGHDLDLPVEDLGHLELEQPLHQVLVRSREHDLRTFWRATHLVDQEPSMLLDGVAFVRRLLGAWQHALGPTEVDDRRAHLEADDLAVDDVPFALGVLAEDMLPLGLAQALLDDLLHRLRADPPEDLGALLDRDHLAQHRILAVGLRLGDGELRLGVLDLLDGGLQHVDAHRAGLRVDLDVEILLRAIGALDRLADDVGDDLFGETLLGGQLGESGHKFPVHYSPPEYCRDKKKEKWVKTHFSTGRAVIWSGGVYHSVAAGRPDCTHATQLREVVAYVAELVLKDASQEDHCDDHADGDDSDDKSVLDETLTGVVAPETHGHLQSSARRRSRKHKGGRPVRGLVRKAYTCRRRSDFGSTAHAPLKRLPLHCCVAGGELVASGARSTDSPRPTTAPARR